MIPENPLRLKDYNYDDIKNLAADDREPRKSKKKGRC